MERKSKVTKIIWIVALASVVAAIVALVVNKVTACKLEDDLLDEDYEYDEDDCWDEDYYIEEE